MEWHACYSTPLDFQAHLVKGYLEQFGVPCIIQSLRFSMKPLTFGALGEVRVLVRDDWVHVARGLIKGREEGWQGGRRLARKIGVSRYCKRHLHAVSGRARFSLLAALSGTTASLIDACGPGWRYCRALAARACEPSRQLCRGES